MTKGAAMNYSTKVNTKGANRPMPQVDMNKKVAAHRTLTPDENLQPDPLPDADARSRAPQKPAANWPMTRIKTYSEAG